MGVRNCAELGENLQKIVKRLLNNKLSNQSNYIGGEEHVRENF